MTDDLLSALARQPTPEELQLCEKLLTSGSQNETDALQELARALFNLKEFVYLR